MARSPAACTGSIEQCRRQHANLLVILNDNEMSDLAQCRALNSIWPNSCGALLQYGAQAGGKVLDCCADQGLAARRRAMKGMVVPSTCSRNRLQLSGPIDGHDLDALIDTLSNIKQLEGRSFAHRHQEGPRLQAGGG